MTITASGGLVSISGDAGEAANAEVAADQSVPAVEHRDPGTAGWDPYEVWRTRVKAKRPERDPPDPLGHPGKS